MLQGSTPECGGVADGGGSVDDRLCELGGLKCPTSCSSPNSRYPWAGTDVWHCPVIGSYNLQRHHGTQCHSHSSLSKGTYECGHWGIEHSSGASISVSCLPTPSGHLSCNTGPGCHSVFTPKILRPGCQGHLRKFSSKQCNIWMVCTKQPNSSDQKMLGPMRCPVLGVTENPLRGWKQLSWRREMVGKVRSGKCKGHTMGFRAQEY